MKISFNGTSRDVPDAIWQATVDESAEKNPELSPEEYGLNAVEDMLTNTFNNRKGKSVDILTEKLKTASPDKLQAALAAAQAELDKP